MSVVTFISHDGEKREAPLEEGASLMQIAVDNMVPGIDGDCGGGGAGGTCPLVVGGQGAAALRPRGAVCGTCHVIVEDQWIADVGRSGPVEEEMLAMNPEREPTSRLSCQMRVSESWDGLVVRLPEFQM